MISLEREIEVSMNGQSESGAETEERLDLPHVLQNVWKNTIKKLKRRYRRQDKIEPDNAPIGIEWNIAFLGSLQKATQDWREKNTQREEHNMRVDLYRSGAKRATLIFPTDTPSHTPGSATGPAEQHVLMVFYPGWSENEARENLDALFKNFAPAIEQEILSSENTIKAIEKDLSEPKNDAAKRKRERYAALHKSAILSGNTLPEAGHYEGVTVNGVYQDVVPFTVVEDPEQHFIPLLH